MFKAWKSWLWRGIVYPKDMKYQDDSQHLYINLKAGKHLNGNQAIARFATTKMAISVGFSGSKF